MNSQDKQSVEARHMEAAFQKQIEEGSYNIYGHMNSLRSAKTENNRKRWIWELIQNTKDSCVANNKKPIISIEYQREDEEFIFSHSGKINNNRTENTSGTYGTGFCTTHFVSDLVTLFLEI